MTNQTKQNSQNDQEIDLSNFINGIKNFFKIVFEFVSGVFNFLLRNYLLTALVVIVGFVSGFYLDSINKRHTHQLNVIPNFGSVDYLYAKIDLINSKLEKRDTIFFYNLGILNSNNISEIKISPILDPYSFVRDNETNFDLLKSLAEDSDMNKVIKDELTSKHFSTHQITFSTNGLASNEKTFDPLFKFLNSSDYFALVQKNVLENFDIKLKSNQQTIDQINGILNSFGQTAAGTNTKSDKLVYYNDNTQLNEILGTKDFLTKEQANIRLEMINCDQIIKLKSANLNAPTNSILKFILPIFFANLKKILYLCHRI